MGPILLLDKSALESLNINEAVWLDMFFGANITPLLYIETLADLEKSDKTGRTSEKIVADLAAKTPINGSFPNAHHNAMILQDLFGNTPPMDTHQVVVAAGQPKRDHEGRIGIHIDEFPEQAALNRWFRGEFEELERLYAKTWRSGLNAMNPSKAMDWVGNEVAPGKRFSNLEEVKALADEYVKGSGLEVLNFVMDLLHVPGQAKYPIQLRYIRRGQPPLEEFAPYATYVATVEIFYYLCLRSSFISKERASNKADIAYLYYLPFGHAFVSKDNLHKRVAHLFMEHGQRFVDAIDLKHTLKQTNDYYSQFSDEIEKVGLMRYVSYPSPELNNLVTELWDEFMRPDWREIEDDRKSGKKKKSSDADTVKNLNKQWKEAQPIQRPVRGGMDYAMIGRKTTMRKGKWRILPPELEKADS